MDSQLMLDIRDNTKIMLDITETDCNLDYVNTENINSIDRLCRTCLTERGELRSLFDDRLNEMLMTCANVQVALNDGLPSHICTQCVLQISRAYNFRQQAESSDSTLRQYITNFNQPQGLDSNILEINYDGNNISLAGERNAADNLIIGSVKSEFFLMQEKPGRAEDLDEKKFKTELTAEEVKGPSSQEKQPKGGQETENDTETDFGEDNFLCGDNLELEPSDSDKEKHVCKICSVAFPDIKELNKHAKSHPKTKDHICGECGKVFHYKVGLRTHMRTHGIGERKHMCAQCGKRFYEPNDLVIHMRRHTGERPIVCETCGKSFADPRSLVKHTKIHTGEKKYQCDICKKRFIHSYTLTAHRRVHTGEKPFICSTCGHACTTSTQLTLHTRTHTQEKPYACTLCPKNFASKSGLSTHQMTHTGERKYTCSICGKGARTSTDLASHVRTHTGEKPYHCKVPLCSKKYRTHSQLSAHMRTHTGEKNHKCPICGKAFADTSQLKSHTNVHTGLKPYVCATCGHRFTQSGSLYTHMKSHR